MLEKVKIDKLVHGGQGLGTLSDGRKVFVWNALPGETVGVRIGKQRKDYAEGIAEEIIDVSPERIDPKDEAYLSTSPWQIMTWEAENKYKQVILEETFAREKVTVPKIEFIAASGRAATSGPYGYRNKMEYSFWGDDTGLHLALFHRASHGKRIITGSSIARPEIDETANKICALLDTKNVRASQLKTVVVRCNQAGETVAALFVKDEAFPPLKDLGSICKGVAVYFSNPKSPASIVTKKRYEYGNLTLTDTILGTSIMYDVNSFFQVNLPIFEVALAAIKTAVNNSKEVVDMYAGVGTIGLCLGATTIVELDKHNVVMARQNANKNLVNIIEASAEQSLDYITPTATIIFDPPRAGLHDKVIDRILDTLPPKLVYLSCNPVTQARDLAKLQDKYEITSLTGYNFFPRTPHIESLAVLELKP